MRKIISTALLLAAFFFVSAQDKETEQLRQQISAHTAQDTFRVNRLNRLAYSGNVPLAETEKLAEEALAISRKLGYLDGEGFALMNLGNVKSQGGDKPGATVLLKQADSIAAQTGNLELLIYVTLRMAANVRQNDNKLALSYAIKAEELAHKSDDKALLSRCEGMIASIYQNSLSDYSKAMEYDLKAISSAEEAGCLSCLATQWSSLASIYSQIGDQDKALLYYQKALDANKQLGNKAIAGTLFVNIGERYRLMGKYPEAIESYKQSLAGEKSPYRIELCESDLADVYVRTDSLPLAFEYGFRSLNTAKKIEDIEGVSWIDGILSRAYLKNKMPDSAIHYAMHGLDAARQTGTIEFMRDNAEALSNAYVYKNDFKNAYSYYTLYITYRDSMLNAQVSNKSTVLEYNYDLQKKQAEITVLNQQKKLQQYFLISVSAVLILIILTAVALLRNNQQKQKALAELKQAQEQLVQSEKMASLGELTAGIAHEIQNPLNFVNNFSDINKDLIDELQAELKSGNTAEALALSNDIKDNEQKILHHGKRADSIVKGMLQHSRVSTGQKEPANINTLADEYLRLSYHGMRGTDKSFNVTLHTDFDAAIGKINIVSQDIGRVLLNLYNNAFYAVNDKLKKTNGHGYKPTVSVTTKKLADKIEIRVNDNGSGIPAKIVDKIFQPFFTTKPTGQGTGLGLSLSYDIIKAHGGEIKVETKEDEGTTFIIQLQKS